MIRRRLLDATSGPIETRILFAVYTAMTPEQRNTYLSGKDQRPSRATTPPHERPSS